MSALTDTERLVRNTLAAKPFYRSDQGPVLVRILDQHCQSNEHRRRVCEAAVLLRFGPEDKLEDRCPGPAELAELCAQIPAADPAGEASPDCKFCQGDGFEPTQNGARRCRCGGSPMTDESRAEFYRREMMRESPAERLAMAEWASDLVKGIGQKGGNL